MQDESIAVVLAGGSGSRFHTTKPKQLALLAGQPILYHSLRKFDQAGRFDRIVVVANESYFAEIGNICEEALRRTPYVITAGGPDRNSSVGNAIVTLEQEEARVLIHDSVRPLVRLDLIDRVLEALTSVRCVIPVIPSVDPIVEVRGGRVTGFKDRKTVYRGQSPQGFMLSDLRETLVKSDSSGTKAFTTIYEALLERFPLLEIGVVEGDLNNLKITMPVDHMIAGRLLLEE